MLPVGLPTVLSSYLFKINLTSAKTGSRLLANTSQEHDHQVANIFCKPERGKALSQVGPRTPEKLEKCQSHVSELIATDLLASRVPGGSKTAELPQ